MSMTASEVAAYLEAHPEFFDQHSELLTQVRVPHARSEYAVPLVERQVLALRDKNRQLGAKMSQLIRFGEHNDQTITRLHTLSLCSVHSRMTCTLLPFAFFAILFYRSSPFLLFLSQRQK
jgi:uncharacterized protein YigA (DUF484 family)